MQPFTHDALPGRVIFGTGTLPRIVEELQTLGCRRVLLLSTPSQLLVAEQLKALLAGRLAGVFSDVVMHTPVEVSECATALAASLGADGIVSLGGGSTIGLGKAIALRTGLPQIAIPTTYAGSEATPILGQTDHGIKTTQRTLDVLPEVILYDVELTLGLPPALSVTSGFNAIAHAVEALYAEQASPLLGAFAEQGIRALAKALPIIVDNPNDGEARSDALFGAWACGVCLGSVGMALHHKLCHTLGGSFDLPHAQTHTVLLPHVAAFNSAAAPKAMARIAEALGAQQAATGLYDLASRLGAPTSLAALGFDHADLARAAEIASQHHYWNPRELNHAAILVVLENAYRGNRP